MLERLNIGELEGDLSSSDDTESEVSEEAEPLIIQLMESMFTRKKTVEETTHMISQVDIEAIREEIRASRMANKVAGTEAIMEQAFVKRMAECERLN